MLQAVGWGAPTWNLRELAGLVLLVSGEIGADPFSILRREGVARSFLLIERRYHHLRIQPLLIFHEHDAQNDSAHQLTTWQWGAKDQHVEWIAVIRHRLRYEAIVHGITADVLGHDTIDGAKIGRASCR